MNQYSALELAGGEIYLQPPDQWPPEPVIIPAAGAQPQATARSHGVTSGVLAPLLEAGVLQPGETLTWRRRNKGATYTAAVLPGGALQTADGRVHATACAAAVQHQRDLRQQRVAGLAALRRRIPGQPPPATADPLPAPVQSQNPLTPIRRAARAAACRTGSGHRHKQLSKAPKPG
jgi:hypothetical protein